MSRSAQCTGCGQWRSVEPSADGPMLCAACRTDPEDEATGAAPRNQPPRRNTSSLLGPLLFLAVMIGAVAFIRHPPAGSVAAEPPLVQVTEPPRLLTTRLGVDDYPAAALKAGEQGTTTVRLTVGTDGMVQRCAIRRSSGFATLDAASCSGLMRSTFQPARGADGRPARSDMDLPIAWRLPE